jgi:hypothetical protein
MSLGRPGAGARGRQPSGSGPLLAFPPGCREDRFHEGNTGFSVFVRAMTFNGDDAIPLSFLQMLHATSDVLRVDPAADRNDGAANAGFFTTRGGSQIGADILNMAMGDVGPEGLQVIERIMAGDERVAGIEIDSQVLGIEMTEQPLHEPDVIRIGPVRFHVDDDIVILSPGQTLPVVVARDPEYLFAGEPRRLERAIHRIDHGTA